MSSKLKFKLLQANWHARSIAEDKIRLRLQEAYGPDYFVAANKTELQKLERAGVQTQKASEKFYTWLDCNSPRNWRSGIPIWWVCSELTYEDAMTKDRLANMPPPAFGYTIKDRETFAKAL